MSTKQGGSVSGTALPDSFPSAPYSPEEPLIQAGFPPLGSLQVKTRRSFSMAAEIVPPCFCTMAAAMARPMPKPPCFFLFREGSARQHVMKQREYGQRQTGACKINQNVFQYAVLFHAVSSFAGNLSPGVHSITPQLITNLKAAAGVNNK